MFIIQSIIYTIEAPVKLNHLLVAYSNFPYDNNAIIKTIFNKI